MSEEGPQPLESLPDPVCPLCQAPLKKHELIPGGSANTYECDTYQWASSIPNQAGRFASGFMSSTCQLRQIPAQNWPKE